MSDCSGVSGNRPVSQNLPLYQALGFNDKNKNGVIEERKSRWERIVNGAKNISSEIENLQHIFDPYLFNLDYQITAFGSEGYRKEADIDGNGKIVEAEIKYYLHVQNIADAWILPVSERYSELEKQFPITEDDKEVLSRLFSQKWKSIIEENTNKPLADYYAWRLMCLASETAKAGLFNMALEVKKTIQDHESYVLGKNTTYQSAAGRYIAIEMFRAGLFNEALKLAETLNISDKSGVVDQMIEMAESKGTNKNYLPELSKLKSKIEADRKEKDMPKQNEVGKKLIFSI